MMDISSKKAQTIINEIGSIVGRQLNFMNARGIVIASTNPERIGQFHEGAAIILRDSLPELTILREDEYAGAQMGCNFPLLLEGQVVGAIGITGSYDEVHPYGQIIKKMTEILLNDVHVTAKREVDERIRQRFFDDWLTTNVDTSSNVFIARAQAQNIDLNIPRRILMFQIADLSCYGDTTSGQTVIDTVNRLVSNAVCSYPNALFTTTASSMICLLPFPDDDRISTFAQEIMVQVHTVYNLRLIAGVDGVTQSNLPQRYQQASKALKAASASHTPLRFYDSLTYELFLEEISVPSQQAFIAQLLKDFSSEQRHEALRLIKLLYKTNGSITRTAKLCHMHTNTLQYKLRALAQKTGYDPRKYDFIPLYTLAIVFEGI